MKYQIGIHVALIQFGHVVFVNTFSGGFPPTGPASVAIIHFLLVYSEKINLMPLLAEFYGQVGSEILIFIILSRTINKGDLHGCFKLILNSQK